MNNIKKKKIQTNAVLFLLSMHQRTLKAIDQGSKKQQHFNIANKNNHY